VLQSISTQTDVRGALGPVNVPASIVGNVATPASSGAPLPVINASGAPAVDGSGTIASGGAAQVLFGGLTPSNGFLVCNTIAHRPPASAMSAPPAAAGYIADESQWGARLRAAPPNSTGMRQNPRFAAIDELVRAARDGEIDIFGRFNRTGEHLLISQQYWLYASIDMGSAIGADVKPAFTIPISTDLGQRERFTPYDGLCVENSDLVRVWPKRS